MEIRQLKTFMHIVKLGNFVQAAQFLGYTQSTVTTHIQLLEKELDTILFERFGHQLTLTTDGEQLYDYAEQIIKLADDAKNTFGNSRIPRGPLLIGMPESVCVYQLPELLKEYSALYPNVHLDFKFGVTNEFRTLLRKNMIDLAFFLEKSLDDADLISYYLWPEPIVVVAAPTHPLALQQQISPSDFQGQTLILVESGSSYRNVLERSLEKASVRYRTLEVCRIQTIKQLVSASLGITVLPLVTVKEELQSGSLAILPWPDAEQELQFNTYLVHHKSKWLSHTIRSFIKLIQERMTK